LSQNEGMCVGKNWLLGEMHKELGFSVRYIVKEIKPEREFWNWIFWYYRNIRQQDFTIKLPPTQSLDTKEGLKEFAESVLRGVKSFSLRDEAILGELAEEKNYVATMEGTHRILGGEYEPSIEEYTPRERLALAWFITNPAKGWEEIFKEKQFALQDVKVVILEKEVAKLAGYPFI